MPRMTAKPIRRPHQPNALKAHGAKLSVPAKLKIKRGDTVKIITGKDKGQVGLVAVVNPKTQKIVVVQKDDSSKEEQYTPLNAAVKHRKARMQGERSARVAIPKPLHISNVMLVDPSTNEPTRVGRRIEDGKLVRYGKKSGKVITDASYKD